MKKPLVLYTSPQPDAQLYALVRQMEAQAQPVIIRPLSECPARGVVSNNS